MKTCVFDYCLKNYSDDEIEDKFMELYGAVKYIMSYIGINETDDHASYAVRYIIRTYDKNEVVDLDNYCMSLINYMFSVIAD